MATSPTLQDGPEIQRRRIEAGINRATLAERAGFDRSYIWLLENNRRSAQPEALAAIAAVLPDCTVKDLLLNRQVAAQAKGAAGQAAAWMKRPAGISGGPGDAPRYSG